MQIQIKYRDKNKKMHPDTEKIFSRKDVYFSEPIKYE